MSDLDDVRQDIIGALRPMDEFVDSGFIYILNRDYLIPRGIMIALYIDDQEGRTSLGWTCIDVDTAIATGVFPDQEVIDAREQAFEAFEC